LRRPLEAFPLAIFAMAAFEYGAFKQAAGGHVYWPMPFAPYFALAVGVLAETASAVARWGLSSTRTERFEPRALAVVLAVLGLGLVAIVPDGLAWMRYARRTGGRLNDIGRLNLRETDKEQALEWMAATMAPATSVALHSGMRRSWSQEWALHRPITEQGGLPIPGAGDPRYFVADLSFLRGEEQRQLAQRFHVDAVGSFVVVDRLAPASPARAFTFDEREPSPLEWYFVSGIDPVRTIREDPWATWELREHWGQAANPIPDGAPDGVEHLRVAHNVAVTAGEGGRALELRSRLAAQLDRSVATDFDDGTTLLGARYVDGVAPMLELYFVAGPPGADGVQFYVQAQVLRNERFTLVPMDDRIKAVGTPLVLPPSLWRRGFIYVHRTEIAHRPGTEAFRGRFGGADRAPRPIVGSPWIGLLTLP
jgi:hypothetical protein